MKIDLKNLNIKTAHQHLIKGDFSSEELTKECLNVIKEKNKDINAYLEVFEKNALERANDADKKIKEGKYTELTGIPLAIKDNILIKGQKASAGSKILENYTATYDATVIKKLKDAGAVFLGRTNMDEFAMGSSTENSAFGVTRNPLDLERVPGGSSGGSTSAVAMNSCLGALGSDTGGSVRQPSSFCGLVGLKPTYGSVSRNGLIALGSSFDVIGPIGKTTSDVEIIFNTIKGGDDLDSTTIQESKKVYPVKSREAGISLGVKLFNRARIIGVPSFVNEIGGMDNFAKNNFNESIKRLEAIGYQTKEVSLPNVKYAISAYYVTLPAEASANLARFDGVRYGLHKDGENGIDDYLKTRGVGFGKEVRRRIILGTYVLSAGYYDAYYNKAQDVRDLIREDFKSAFKEVDVIITPTTTGSAFKIGEKVNDPVRMYLEDIFTVSANLAGIPAISIPSNKKEDGSFDGGLPLGLQIIAPQMEEDVLFEIAKNFLGEK
ncbi:MAG: aspartyl-tRNA(Asn)/glutamyl-tRNA (Gln) amidotransferase subunit A [Parcubacteria group bacterium Athens0714_16]|nr:MAG: aspartyl-tRNA(Asn)/glutamyl-tRNA (Gln) amidotransferase subunit A [Parcubacteria group bacterium Athens0714_16]